MKSQLSNLEATGLVVGAGIGGGVMAVPYLASQIGITAFLPLILVASVINITLNLLLVDVLVRDGRDLQIVELMSTYVFRGRVGKLISWGFFVVLGLSFIASLTAYVSGAGVVMAELSGISPLGGQLIVYGVSAVIVFLGLKVIGISEKISLHLFFLFSGIILFGSLNIWNPPIESFRFFRGSRRDVLAVYGIIMYSLNAAFAVPQAVQGLGRDRVRASRAVVAGTILNASLIILITLVAIAVSDPVTEVAIIGIGAATNRVVEITGSLFVIVAMLTTYWSVSLALADIMAQRLGIGSRSAWLAATGPTLVLILSGLKGFIGFMQIAGGFVALVVVYITVPMFRRARREHPCEESRGIWKMLGSPLILGLFILGMILMAGGSFAGLAG